MVCRRLTWWMQAPAKKAQQPVVDRTVVEGGAVVRQEVAVDVVIQRFAGAAISNARVGVGGEPAKKIRRCVPVLGARRVIHASQGGDMILRDRESTASKPEAAADARPVSRAVRCICVVGASTFSFGEHATRCPGSRGVMSIEEAVLLDDVPCTQHSRMSRTISPGTD